MLKEARNHYDKIIERANDFLEKTNREIHGVSERHLKVQLQHETKIKILILQVLRQNTGCNKDIHWKIA